MFEFFAHLDGMTAPLLVGVCAMQAAGLCYVVHTVRNLRKSPPMQPSTDMTTTVLPAEAALNQALTQQARDAQLYWLLEQNPDPCYVIDGRGRLIGGNTLFAKLLGCDHAILLSDDRYLASLYYTAARRQTVLLDRLQKEHHVTQFRSTINLCSGTTINVVEAGRRLPTSGADAACYLITVHPAVETTAATAERSAVTASQRSELSKQLDLLDNLCNALVQAESSPQKSARLIGSIQETTDECRRMLNLEQHHTALRDYPLVKTEETDVETQDAQVMQWLTQTPNDPTPTINAVAGQISSVDRRKVLTQQLRELSTAAESGTEIERSLEKIQHLLAGVEQSALQSEADNGPQGRGDDAQFRDEPPARRRQNDQPFNMRALLRRCVERDDFAWQMLRKFPPRFKSEAAGLRAAIELRDSILTRQRTVQMRSMAANLGADQLVAVLVDLEAACRENAWERVELLQDGMETEFERCRTFIRNEAGDCDNEIVGHADIARLLLETESARLHGELCSYNI